MTNWTPLEPLKIADPDTYVWVKGRVALMAVPPAPQSLALLAKQTIWALSLEAGLGRAVAKGLLLLMEKASPGLINTYIRMVHQAAETGATLGRIVATYLAPVAAHGDRFIDSFLETLTVMQAKGTYTLSAPMDVLTQLLASGDESSASAYLELLTGIFSQELSYNRSVRLVYVLPKAVSGFAPQRRAYQIAQLDKVVRTELTLLEPFLEGMQKGLAWLSVEALEQFVDSALVQYRQRANGGIQYLSLVSKAGQDACAALQVAVSLGQIKAQLNRYLNARIGRPVAVKSLSALSQSIHALDLWVCSDGRSIYLADEIDYLATRDRNVRLFKMLVRLEAGYFENRSFDFDLQRAADTYPSMAEWVRCHGQEQPSFQTCDAEFFISRFARPQLADDLFNLFEQARVGMCMTKKYPGLTTKALPLLHAEVRNMRQNGDWHHPLAPLYARLVLNMQDSGDSSDPDTAGMCAALERQFRQSIDAHIPVEACAWLVCEVFEQVRSVLTGKGQTYDRLMTPYKRRLRWDLVSRANTRHAQTADRIMRRLAEQGLSVYRSDLQNRLADQQGQLSPDDIRALTLARANSKHKSALNLDLSCLQLDNVVRAAGADPAGQNSLNGPAYRYPEWDDQLQDYLDDYTRVQETTGRTAGSDDGYRHTLVRHRGMVAHIRRAFKLLRPEGLTLLRQWPEGDAFDYRALLDFAMDRRAGRIPSERLFIKRLKQVRDVAVLLLVDLSRSTGNLAAGGEATVLDVAKEALVLFCEALQVVGDDYAIAGFSGTGRHSVDYFRIKDFQEPLSDIIQERISALTPQRSTRMGAAIRHATAQLTQASARVRLLIVVSDGFPNDLGYKADYATADTRRAVQEARAKGFHVKAITVNIGSDPRLDDLYGRFHHQVIGAVEDLPDKLLRLYGTLTRY